MNFQKDKTAGERFVAEYFPSDGKPWGKARAAAAADRIERALNAAVETAMAAGATAGFKLGFEHAVAGGEEASMRLRSLKASDPMPLVLYFLNEADRQEMIDALTPGLVEIKIPERRK